MSSEANKPIVVILCCQGIYDLNVYGPGMHHVMPLTQLVRCEFAPGHVELKFRIITRSEPNDESRIDGTGL